MVSEEKQKNPKLCTQPPSQCMSIFTAEGKIDAIGSPGPLLQHQPSSLRDGGACAGRKALRAPQHHGAGPRAAGSELVHQHKPPGEEEPVL